MDKTKTYYWQILVTDSRGATSLSDLFSFTTEGVSNLKPVVTQIETQEITEGSTFSIYLPDYITDPEGDSITFSLGENNEIGGITEGSTFIYYADYDTVTTAEGSKTFNVVIEAWDEEHINNPTQLTFTIKVLNKNRAPEIELTTPTNGKKSEDTTGVKFSWEATDLDNDDMTYSFYLGTNQNSFDILDGVKPDGDKSYTYKGTLEEGTTYYWKVKVSDGNDEVASEIWSFTTKGFRDGGQKDKISVNNPIRKGLVISEDGYLFFTSDYGENEGKLYVYNATNPGESAIAEVIIDSPVTTIPTLDNNNTVYFATLEGKVYAYEFDGENLEEKWEFIVGVPVYTSPAIDGQGRLYIGDNDGILHVIDKENGEEITTYVTKDKKIKSSVAIDNSGNIYFGSYDGNLYGLKWNNSTLEDLTGFPISVDNEKIVTSPAIDNENKKLYFATLSGKIYEVDLTDGTKTELLDTEEYIRISPLIGENVYFVTTTGKLYKRNELIKNFGIEISGVPAIGEDNVGNELIYVPVLGKVYALDSSGNVRWIFSTSSDEPIRGNIEIAKDGSIYAGSTDGNLYIIYDSENSGIYSGKWPVFQKNSMHTGGNRAPLKPYNLNPENGKLKIAPEEDLTLKWNGRDYDNDTLTYYIYKGIVKITFLF
ncbi:outer membrane protein assembly factor BamB family protein [Marinitoga lauensis]|uniref:outer membrane protein assembly factor BamB family protein n=1 Tax=Marinitoga lauensis TaxID=2201189 RepID=UPI0010111F37|nr:PQQ-binding-like beta-propeller repeat protein [Marinitoga lauensis]